MNKKIYQTENFFEATRANVLQYYRKNFNDKFRRQAVNIQQFRAFMAALPAPKIIQTYHINVDENLAVVSQ